MTRTPARTLGSARGGLKMAQGQLETAKRTLANATDKGFRTRMMNEIAARESEVATLAEKVARLESEIGGGSGRLEQK